MSAGAIDYGHNFSGLQNQEESNILGLHQSMCVNNLVNHIGNYISEPMTYGETSEYKDIMDDDFNLILDDTYTMYDENSVMSKVNSLGWLPQIPVVGSSHQPGRETSMNGHTEFEPKNMSNSTPANMSEINTMGQDITLINSCEQPDMPSIDSFEDLMRSQTDWLSPKYFT